jgi:serine/threonine protein phosphatase 1
MIGDIHGAYRALLQCLKRSGLDYRRDRLVVLGDICDGYPEVRECIDELIKIRDCILVTGNHDRWLFEWALRGEEPDIWLCQGGIHTIRSYPGKIVPKRHIRFLKRGRLWLKSKNQFFSHGEMDSRILLFCRGMKVFRRELPFLEIARRKHRQNAAYQFGKFRDIFLGHTPTEVYHRLVPVHFCNVWGLDTGAGRAGKLTIMDAETKEYWQSDLVTNLYE